MVAYFIGLPLILYTNNIKLNGDNMIKEMFEIVLLIFIFIGILALTYFVTKKMASFNKQMGFNKNMEMIEVIQLMQGQYLYIVKVGTQYHLIGSTQKGSICYCTRLEENELDLQEVKMTTFREQLSQFMKGRQVNEHENK